MLLEAYGGEAMKKSYAFEWHKQFKEGREKVEHNGENAHHFLRYQGYCSLLNPFHMANQWTKLIMWRY
jgi:hypothetical protein